MTKTVKIIVVILGVVMIGFLGMALVFDFVWDLLK